MEHKTGVLMEQASIKVKNVTVQLGGKEILRNLTVNLPEGKVIGFIGPSGAGKTTLIRAIVGRQHLDKGSITIFGSPAGSIQLREQMGYMTQEVSVYDDLTVHENLQYFAIMFGKKKKEIKPLIAEILKTVDMVKQSKQIVSKLSGGQKQRVSLAIALIGYPKLLVLDEPTVGLDPVLREQLWTLFRTLAQQGTTLVISSHVMDEAERCDDLLLIRDGKLLAHGSPKELCAQTETKSVGQAFLNLIGEKA
jgi:ABC-2 type transport system ATP-binding protein